MVCLHSSEPVDAGQQVCGCHVCWINLDWAYCDYLVAGPLRKVSRLNISRARGTAGVHRPTCKSDTIRAKKLKIINSFLEAAGTGWSSFWSSGTRSS